MASAGLMASHPAQAVDFGTSLIYRYESSDNIDRAADVDEVQAEDGSRQSVTAEFSGSSRARVLDMDFDLTVGLSEGDGVDDERVTDTRGGIYALLNLRPGQFSWLLADYIVQEGEDFAALTDKDLRSRANYFVTGPSTRWRLTPVDSLNIDLFYLLSDVEGDPEQTRQLAFQGDWSHRFTPQHSVGLHLENTDISFKQSDDEFNISNVFGRYAYTQAKTRFNIDVGSSDAEDQDDATQTTATTSESLYRLGWSRQMSRELNVGLQASQVYTDETLGTIRDLQANLNSGLNVGSGPYYEKRVALEFSRGGALWNARLGFSNTDMEFVDQNNVENIDSDRTVQRTALELSYAISPVWGLRLYGSQDDVEYDLDSRTEDKQSYGAGLSYQITASLSASVDVSLNSIDSSDPEEGLTEENNVGFSLAWKPQTKLLRLREQYESKQIDNVLQ